MRARVRLYGRLLRAGIRRQSTYRLAALGGLVANTTFGFLKVAILFATVRAAGGSLHGYDVAAMSSYIWISQGMLGSINVNGHSDIADRIKSGDVAIDFLRPVSIQGAFVATEVGRSVWSLVPRGLPSVLIGGLIVGMALPSSPAVYVAGALSLLLGFAVSASSVYCLATIGFWLVESRGVQVLYMVLSGFFAGLFVPIYLFPDWLLMIAQATPFPSMLMYPTDILSGRATGTNILALLGAQAVWLVITWTVGEVATMAGRRRLEVQGG